MRTTDLDRGQGRSPAHPTPSDPGSTADASARPLIQFNNPPLERLLSVDRVNSLYRGAVGAADIGEFLKRLVDGLGVRVRISREDLESIPRTGPLVVVANHPFGALDGILLAMILRQVRPDAKILANYLLGRIPEMRELFFFVDPFGGESATASNLTGMRDAMRHLKDGGLLATFPAGEVAHFHPRRGEITDPVWSTTIARLVRKSRATVVPIYFDGHNGPLFQLAGLVHKRLRTALLAHELFRKTNQTIDIRVGSVIPRRKIEACDTDADLTGFFRQRTFVLKHRGRTCASDSRLRGSMEPIIDPIDPQDLDREVAALPPGSVLVDADEFLVLHARAPQIPRTLREIGRLREATFRAAAEGTGKNIDLDTFDYDYTHLWVWNRLKKQVVGAYRLGHTDKILAAKGPGGLYTRTLFNFGPRMLHRIGPALEMGRSFVRQEYQRSFSPLLLLWRGIGTYVVRNPRYKNLLGPVSISNSYQSVSKQLMVQFLKMHHMLPMLADMVRARNPFRIRKITGLEREAMEKLVLDSDEVSELVSDLEPDHKGIPILLKQYLKLGAKLLSFNVDPEFSDVVDGLILVDLTRTDPRHLDKYMGKEGRAAFLAYHNTSR